MTRCGLPPAPRTPGPPTTARRGLGRRFADLGVRTRIYLVAAGAGEVGEGFAVVTNEVMELAAMAGGLHVEVADFTA